MTAVRGLGIGLLVALGAAIGPAAALADTPVRDAAEIQARIDAASPGAVIVVEPGTYAGRIEVDRAITLRGEGRPVIDGGGLDTVVTISGDGAVLEGFLVRGSGIGPVGGPAGIKVTADDVLVQDNVVEDTYMGIAAYGASSVKIVGNTVRGRQGATIGQEGHASAPDEQSDQAAEGAHAASGRVYRGDAISLWDSEGVLVRDNLVEDARDGIYMSFGTDILLDRNVVLDSRYAIHSMYASNLTAVENRFERNLSGAVLMYGGPVLLLRNDIRDSPSASTGFGILLKDVSGVDAIENVIVGNRIGVQVDGPLGDAEHHVAIRGNTVAMNDFGVSLYPSAEVTFSRNSFVENTVQVVAQGEGVEGKNTWYDDGVGNYWSNYRGYDLTGEGLGDVPHMEGGTVERLMVRAPVLQALASGPALGLLRAVEDRWVEHRPVLVDHLPLMHPDSPPLAGGAVAGPAPAVLAGSGLAAVVLAVLVIASLRRPFRRGRVAHA